MHSSPAPPALDRSYGGIFALAIPLILTTSGFMVMQFIDALFLSWYSPNAVAAAIPAGMANWLVVSAFVGTAGYTATFVAQYVGAGQRSRVAATVWQGIYLALGSGVIIALCALLAAPLFNWVGHGEPVRSMEIVFFKITCWGAVGPVLAGALAGFFTGRDDTKTIFVVQLAGLMINAVLDYALIFGRLGLPRLGITGAAIATVVAQLVIALLFLLLFLAPRQRREYATGSKRRFEPAIVKQFIRFGVPNGLRFSVEMLAWTLFIFFVGRIGTKELVETTIAWRINGIAFFPIIGLGQAISILVGNAQGAKRPDISARTTVKGLRMAELWMIAASVLFVACPRELYGLFYNPQTMRAADFQEIAGAGVVLLRLVALYCLMDAVNIIIMGTLVAAGDTTWTLVGSLGLHGLFLAGLWLADARRAGFMVEWSLATVFVICSAVVWLIRYRLGRWKTIELTAPVALVAVPPEKALADSLAPAANRD